MGHQCKPNGRVLFLLNGDSIVSTSISTAVTPGSGELESCRSGGWVLRMPARLAVGCAWNAVALLVQETWNVMGCVGGGPRGCRGSPGGLV